MVCSSTDELQLHSRSRVERPNLSPQPTALSWRLAGWVGPAAVSIGEGTLPESGGGWAPGR